jgi:hypothetical protein
MRLVRPALVAALVVLGGCMPSVRPLKEYSYPAWGFAVSLPAAPVVTDTPASADGVHPHTLMLEVRDAGHDYVVAATDASQTTKSDDEILNTVPGKVAEAGGATVSMTTYVATGAVVGREARLDKPGQAPLQLRVFVAGKKLYQVSAQSTHGLKDPETARVLDGFRLLAAK